MKILFVIDKMKNYAGIERILTCKMNHIATHTNHQVLLTTYEQHGQELPFKLLDNIAYQPIDVPTPQRSDYTFLQWLRAYRRTRQHFRRQFTNLLLCTQPDIVISTVYSYQVLDIIINTSHCQGIKTIMESHTKGATVTMAYKFQYNQVLFKLFSLWDEYIMRSLNHCNCVVTLTQQDVPFWSRYAPRIEVIPNMLTITPKRVADYHTRRVISAGRYMSEKGFDMLLKAWHLLSDSYSDWHLYIFGNGDRTAYQSLVNQYQMNDHVHLMPATPDIAAEFSNSSIYVMSSRYEGFGLVLAEAMSCGLPCVSFDCPYGPREIISDGEDGILVKNGDIEELARSMEQLMADVALRQTMGERAIKNIARYAPDAIMTTWINLFKNL